MSKVTAFHSKKPGTRNVYHDNNKCTEGKAIESYIRSSGSENRPLCEQCETLNSSEPLVAQQESSGGLAASFMSAVRRGFRH